MQDEAEQPVETLFAEAVSHHQVGRLSEAERLYRRILAQVPDQPVVLHHLGVIAQQREQTDAAIDLILRALISRPAYPEALSNLGLAERDRGDLDHAARHFARAARLRPDIAAFHNNLAGTLRQMGQLDAAIEAFRRAVALAPDSAEIHANFAAALLHRGDFAEGWQEHEWRLSGDGAWAAARGVAERTWDGRNAARRTILLHTEQGLGDDLQFIRYAGLIAAQGARVVVETARPLVRLFSGLPGIERVVAVGETLPFFDAHLSLMSAPHRLGTRLETIPAKVPYLFAEPRLSEEWRARLAGLRGLKVGLVWAGDSRPHDRGAHAIDRRRSMALATLAPLLERKSISFVSLQKGEAANQIAALPADLRPFDPMKTVGDFADTAAIIANLDLVISVDTSVAHLAGAMGKPVWIASRFDGCWRWLTERDDTPWYPTARLFRQPAPGDWATVVAGLGRALDGLPGRRDMNGDPPSRAADIPV